MFELRMPGLVDARRLRARAEAVNVGVWEEMSLVCMAIARNAGCGSRVENGGGGI